MSVRAWLDPTTCPDDPPPRSAMAETTRALHDALDARAHQTGVAWLHPSERTVQLDLHGSADVIAWQTQKGDLVLGGEACWSEMPPLYARYGTAATTELNATLRTLYAARAALAVSSGMTAVALVADVLLRRGDHAIVMRQVYNKSRQYFERVAANVGATVSIVDDGDPPQLAATLTPATRVVFAETFTNPRLRAQDVPALARALGPSVALVIDDTIATPWGVRASLLHLGAHVVVGSATKALSGHDTVLAGYVATNDVDLGNALMDLLAMRGGVLDQGSALTILRGLYDAERAHAARSATAATVAAFLAGHPRVAEVFHPSLPDHPDAAVIARDYVRTGSLLSFRVRDADEEATRHVADVLAMCEVARYALSFDGLTTKINHHRTVSEYYTPLDMLARGGLDRLVRIGIGLEAADDLCACLNWALHHAPRVSPDELARWRDARHAH